MGTVGSPHRSPTSGKPVVQTEDRECALCSRITRKVLVWVQPGDKTSNTVLSELGRLLHWSL